MWNLRSRVLETDIFLTGFDGIVEDRGRYIVVRTPSNPNYWWGNFLIYREAPDADAAVRGRAGCWLDDHARELPGMSAVVLAWDRPDGARGEVEPFLEEGFELDHATILSATAAELVRPPRHNDAVVVRPLASDADWRGATRALTNANGTPERRSGTLEEVRAFVARQMERYRAMQAAGFGQWYGGFVDGKVAGTLGLVRIGEGGDLGRFQLVGTDPAFARQGVCSTLVHEVARRALETEGFSTLLMAADADYHAAKVYESVGFRQTERLCALMKKPPAA